MTRIHRTAIVEAGAELDAAVEVGPYSIIGAHVRIGAGTRLGAHCVIEGHTTLGAENCIGHAVMLGGVPQDMKFGGEFTRLEIGARNTIREFTTIHVGTAQDEGVTQIGDENWIMAYVHIGHDCRVGSHTVLASNAQMAGHVRIGDWAIVGGMTGVHQFVRIGAHAMIGGASALRQDVPPYVTCAGNEVAPHGINVEGLRRRGFAAPAIALLRQAYRLLYKSSLPVAQAVLKIRELAQSGPDGEPARILADFVAQSSRGIIR